MRVAVFQNADPSKALYIRCTVYRYVCKLHVPSSNSSLTVAGLQGGKEKLQIYAIFSFFALYIIILYLKLHVFYVRSPGCEKRLSVPSCLSDRPSVRMDQLRYHLTDFREISYLCIFRNCDAKNHILLQADMNCGHFT